MIDRQDSTVYNSSMAEKMSSDERIRLIRKGNEFYNKGDIESAKRIFLQTNYSGGLIRVADYYCEQRKPAAALLLYRQAGCRQKVEELYERIVAVIRLLLEQDRRDGVPDVSVSELSGGVEPGGSGTF